MNLGYGTNKSTGIVLELITFVPQNILRLVPQIITLTTLCPLPSLSPLSPSLWRLPSPPSRHLYRLSLGFICLYQHSTKCESFTLVPSPPFDLSFPIRRIEMLAGFHISSRVGPLKLNDIPAADEPD